MAEIEPVSSVVEWREPPAVPSTVSRLQRVTAELQRRPGEWALIATSSPVLFTWWGSLHDHPDFEVTTRRTHGNDKTLFGPRDVYARYVGRLGDRLQPEGTSPAE